jgi:uncharacterized protein (DUF2267 family)
VKRRGEPPEKDKPRRPYVCRGELRLARDSVEPLADLGLDPDPLGVYARVFALARDELQEDIRVAVDMVPASPSQRRRLRGRLAKQASASDLDGPRRRGSRGARAAAAVSGFVAQMAQEANIGPPVRAASAAPLSKIDPLALVRHRSEMREINRKLYEPDAMFELQVLVRTQSLSKGRSKALYQAVLGAFEIFAGDNEFRTSGLRLFMRFGGSDMWWRRWWFDYRLRTGHFDPAGESIVNAREVEPLLKPATRRCPAPNAVRAGVWMAPAPRDLPVYRGQRGVLPLGEVLRDNKMVMVGMNLDEYHFGGLFGRSRFGKTELALVQLAHVALVERLGALFFDPAVDALERIRPYLTEDGVRERVVELNLARTSPKSRHVRWNLLSMDGLREEHIERRADALWDTFSVASGYTTRAAQRTAAIFQAAINSLLHISMQMVANRAPDLQPTIFTVRTLLMDSEFRAAVTARLPPHLAKFWIGEYNNEADGEPIRRFISRVQNNPVLRATFGSPKSTFDPRKALDDRKIILAAPPSPTDTTVSSLIMQCMIDGARSRVNIHRTRRVPSYWHFDETPSWDQGAVAEVFEQVAKYEVYANALAQAPHRLPDATQESLTTNSSFIITTATSARGAKFFAAEWDDVDAKTATRQIRKYNYIAQVTHGGRRIPPFRLAGRPLEEVWGAHSHEDRLDLLDAVQDKLCGSGTVEETLDIIADHDERLLDALRNTGRPVPPRALADAAPEVDDIGTGRFRVRPVRPARRDDDG